MDTRQHLYFIAQRTEAYYRVLQGVIGLVVTKLTIICVLVCLERETQRDPTMHERVGPGTVEHDWK